MLSTALNLRVLTRDLSASLSRTAAQPVTARETAYWNKTIGTVKSIDDFIGDDRLFSYAMKAFGLEEMSYAKGLMRKVLQSDLADPKSFANKLTDARYRDFAAAFNFGKDGKSKSVADLQTSQQEDDLIGLYTNRNTRASTRTTAETAYYTGTIGGISTVGNLLYDDRIVDYLRTTYHLGTASTADMRKALTSDLADPTSFANTTAIEGFKRLAEGFSFQTDGTASPGATAQSTAQTDATVEAYARSVNGGVNATAEAIDTAYYKAHIGAVTSVDDLLADPRLFRYAVTSVGLDPAYQSPSYIRQLLVSDTDDPQSFANKQDIQGYRTLAYAFDFQADGSLAAGDSAQTTAWIDRTVDGYKANYAKPDPTATAYFDVMMRKITTADQLVDDDRLYDYLLTAFEIDPASTSKDDIAALLKSDPDDPKSAVRQADDPKLLALVTHFNVAKDGTARAPALAQSQSAITAMTKAYMTAIGTDKAAQAAAKAEVTYYATQMQSVASLDALLADSRLVGFILKAFGQSPRSLPLASLRKVLLSDPSDQKSYANQQKDLRLRSLAASFNFTSTGSISREALAPAQLRSQRLATVAAFARQTMETDAGADNDGVRLALYFQRKAPSIANAFDVLADKALLQVVQTVLRIPQAASAASIDLQAKLIGAKLKIADLRDPAELDTLLTRFATLYDLDQGQATTAPGLAVLGASPGIGEPVITAIDPGLFVRRSF